MKLFQKMKDILFEEEEVEVQSKPVVEEKEERVNEKEKKEEFKPLETKKSTDMYSNLGEKDIFKSDNTFPFPEFDEEEFVSSVTPSAKPRVSHETKTVTRSPISVSDYEKRPKKVEKRVESTRYDRVESAEAKEKKKFKPSPIISPVYGVLNEDYKAEDVKVRKDDTDIIDVDSVRKKAFGETEEKALNTPTSVLYEDVKTVETSVTELEKTQKVKTIDELLEDTVDTKIKLEDSFEMTDEIPDLRVKSPIALDDFDDELNDLEVNLRSDKFDSKKETKTSDIFEDYEEDNIGNDLLDLFDSMYESKEDGDY